MLKYFWFTFQCLQTYVKDKVKSGKSDIPCPGGKCQRFFQLQEVKQIIQDDNLFAIHEKTRLNKMVVLNDHLIWCPTPDCKTICYAQTKAASSSVLCNQCQSRFCSRCFQDWHAGNPYQSNTSGIPNTKPCPKCQVPIQKVRGCLAMKCSYCHQRFCWSCLKTGAFCCTRFGNLGCTISQYFVLGMAILYMDWIVSFALASLFGTCNAWVSIAMAILVTGNFVYYYFLPEDWNLYNILDLPDLPWNTV